MATIVGMPKWGLAMKSGRVVQWLKRRGETVRQGEPLVEIESEKATNEVEAPASGLVCWIGVEEDDSAPVGAPLAVIAAPGEQLSDEQVAALLRADEETKREAAKRLQRAPVAAKVVAGTTGAGASAGASVSGAVRAAATTTTGGRVNASPAARRLGQELGVDLAAIVGTGPGGMISREDVLGAAEAQRSAAAGESEGEERTINVDGVGIHCLIAGPAGAPPVVFVHGLGGSLATWSLNLPAFAERFRVCALDLPGAGASDKPSAGYEVASLANAVARVMEELGADWLPANLVGHSLGGAVALTLAERFPGRVRRLVLLDSAGLGPEIDGVLLGMMREEPTRAALQAELSRFFAQPGFVQQALVEQLYEQRTQPGAQQALVKTAEAAFDGGTQRIDLRDTLAALTVPMLVIWGAADTVLPAAHARSAELARQGRIEVFEGCGHCPHIERSEAFNTMAMSFLLSA